MGGIDEVALDKLILVTEITEHVRVRASSSSKGSLASELGQFSPLFLWLLRVSFTLLWLVIDLGLQAMNENLPWIT
jgi:hypothetical protein